MNGSATPQRTALSLHGRTWVAAVVAIAALIARKPWALHTPQLWAEDGTIFLNDAESVGLAAIFHPYQGYFHFIPRVIAASARLIADPAGWPSIYNVGALLVAVGVVCRMASPRLVLPHKPWLILALALVPHTGEVLFNITNVQWIAAFFLIVQLFISAPVTLLQTVGDIVLIVVAGLTGPFAVLLLPFFIWRAWCEPGRGRAAIITVIACAALQTWSLTHGAGVPTAPRPAHIDALNYVAVLADRIVIWPFLGARLASTLSAPILAAIGVAAGAVIATLAARRLDQRRFATALTLILLMLLAAVSWRTRPDGWDAHNLNDGDRYFFIPRVLFAWLVVIQLDAMPRIAGWIVSAACIAAIGLQLPHFEVSAPPDYRWAEHCDPVRRGVPANIPTLPEGWILEYRGRPAETR